MITFLGWIAALVALLTALAMLSDTHLSRGSCAQVRTTLRESAAAIFRGQFAALDLAELTVIGRFILRAIVLVLIVASSGVTVFLPFGPGLQASTYESLLRCGLAAFMAMQVPCTWVRWITTGHQPPAAPRGDRHAH